MIHPFKFCSSFSTYLSTAGRRSLSFLSLVPCWMLPSSISNTSFVMHSSFIVHSSFISHSSYIIHSSSIIQSSSIIHSSYIFHSSYVIQASYAKIKILKANLALTAIDSNVRLRIKKPLYFKKNLKVFINIKQIINFKIQTYWTAPRLN